MKIIAQLNPFRGLVWFGIYKRNSTKFWFLFQMEMPKLTHFIVNQK